MFRIAKSNVGKSAMIGMLAIAISLPSAVYGATLEQPNQSLIPLRQAAETLGAKVEWKAEDRTITVARDTTQVVLTIGEKQALINGEEVTLPANVQLKDGKTVVPGQLLALAFESEAEWNDEQNKVHFAQDDYAGRASEFVYGMFNGQASSLIDSMSEALKPALPEQMIAGMAQQLGAFYGKPQKRLSATIESNAVHTNVTQVYETPVTKLEIIVRFDPSGKIDDLHFLPKAADIAYIKPDYDKGNYSEKAVVVGEGTLALPGTLSVPEGEGPFPTVVLVHGSGPHDRDSTINGTKVFKDIAAGLASQGIAVLRYEKVTKEHTAKSSIIPNYTIKNESADDAIKAVQLLKSLEEVDSSRIYIAGHSQGGYVMPLILDGLAEREIAGAILLSAPSERFIDALVEQQDEAIARLQKLEFPKEVITSQEQTANMFKELARLVQDPQYSVDNIPANFPMPPAYYWYENRDFVPAEAAKQHNVPLLILQGENDWQVSMNQYAGWQKALEHRDDVTFHSYPNMNHLLTIFEGLSIGMEYNNPANVSADLIKDVSDWILGK